MPEILLCSTDFWVCWESSVNHWLASDWWAIRSSKGGTSEWFPVVIALLQDKIIVVRLYIHLDVNKYISKINCIYMQVDKITT